MQLGKLHEKFRTHGERGDFTREFEALGGRTSKRS